MFTELIHVHNFQMATYMFTSVFQYLGAVQGMYNILWYLFFDIFSRDTASIKNTFYLCLFPNFSLVIIDHV